MNASLRNIVVSIVVFAVGAIIIETQITGTDAGSNLITGIGYLLLGVVVVGTLVNAAMKGFGGKGG